MNISTRKKWKFPEYPFYVIGLSLFPPLALYALNLGEASLSSLWRPLAFSLLFCLSVFALVFAFTKKIKLAGLITVLSLTPAYVYGHVFLLLENQTVFGFVLGRHRILFPIFAFGLLFTLLLLMKQWHKFLAFHHILNIIFLTLITFQLFVIIPYEVKSALAQEQKKGVGTDKNEHGTEKQPRDIYLIILDSYLRSDWLLDHLDVDNASFLEELESLGFYVADCSRSNYSYTIQSMTSELNMNYLQELDLEEDNLQLSAALKNSGVRKLLTNQGYEFIFFKTGYPWIEMTDADRFIELDETAAWSAFELMFLETTMFKIPYDLYLRNQSDLSVEELLLNDRAKIIQSVLKQLDPSLKKEAPIFVYAHIISPHTPYLFESDGTINYDWEQNPQDSARSTYEYLNKRVIEVLSEIVENSETDPIIILQADHGDGEGGYRNLILNAYYLPEGGADFLYPSITPVNTFRLVFSHYFGMDFPFLDDSSFYSPDDDRFNFESIEDPYDRCQ